METADFGRNVAYYREMLGFSQAELGNRLNVSSQAISRWERGGMPDATLIPRIAEVLGCTPNDLYGVSSTDNFTIEDQLSQILRRTPDDQRTTRAISFAWHLMKSCGALYGADATAILAAAKSCEDADFNPIRKPGGAPTHCAFTFEDGIMQASAAIDFKYVLLMQEPEGGFSSIMRDIQSYQMFFSLFAREHRLETFLLGFSLPKNRPFTESFVSGSLGISDRDAKDALNDLCEHGFIDTYNIQTGTDCIEAYIVPVSPTMIPLLYFAGRLMRDGRTYSVFAPLRNTPLMRSSLPTEDSAKVWKPSVSHSDTLPSPRDNLGQDRE